MRSPRTLLAVAVWIPIVLAVDGVVSTWLLGLFTSALLVALTAAQPTLVRYQVAIVVAFAGAWLSQRWWLSTGRTVETALHASAE